MKLFVSSFLLVFFYNCQQINAECRKPTPSPNVIITYPKGQNGKIKFKENTMLLFSCSLGYESRDGGDPFVICLDNRWNVVEDDETRLSIPFRCFKKPCPVKKPENGIAPVTNNVVQYSCNFGFTLKGPKRAVCRMDSIGDIYLSPKKVPQCLERSQCKKPKIPHLIFNKKCCLNDTMYQFSCPMNYRLIGEKSLKCDDSGNWDGTLPLCQAIPKCNDPGVAAHSTRKGKCCNEGSVVEYICEKDYEILNKNAGNKITCLSNGIWNLPRPICKPVGEAYCDFPPPENNLLIESTADDQRHPELFLPEDMIDFACPKYYQSEQTKFSLVCEEDGLWESELPICSPSDPCPHPRTPKNGRIREIENKKNGSYPVGFEINFECEHGFHIPDGTYFTKCEGNKWEHEIPDCIPIKCADPGVPRNGFRNGDEFTIGKIITFSCMDGMQLLGSPVRQCKENGRWSGHTTVCDAGGTDCPDPGIPISSWRRGNEFNIGNVVYYLCKQGFTLLGNGTRTCMKNGSWSGQEIQCLGKNEFSDYEEVANSLDKTMTEVSRTAMETPMTSALTRSSISVPVDVEGGVNLIFLLDVSNSISYLHFNQSKEFIKMVIRKVGISSHPNGVRAAVVSFSSEVKDIFATNIHDINVALDTVDAIEFDRKGTNIYRAYERASSIILGARSGERKNSKSIIFLISDGLYTEGGLPKDFAKVLQNRYNSDIYAVGVGSQVDEKALTEISNQFFKFENHKNLIAIVEKAIGIQIDFSPCGMERPKYNLETGPGPGPAVSKKSNRQAATMNARIIGGKKVEGSWPWMAAFKLAPQPRFKSIAQDQPKGVLCGGVIIHRNWVLSAAHCFNHNQDDYHNLMSDPRNWELIIGRTNVSIKSAYASPIRSIQSHPLYDSATLDYDIALVQLRTPIIFDYFTRPICLPPLYEELENDTTLYMVKEDATVIGWGIDTAVSVNDTKGKSVDYLNEADVPIQTSEICKNPVRYTQCQKNRCKQVEMNPTETTFCAGSGTDGIDSCKGDSGGPLMQQALSEIKSGNSTVKEYRWFSIGVVSWGVGCGQKGFYGYYSHVSKLREWINNVTQVEFEDFDVW